MGNNASILLIHKPTGVTSFASLNNIKRTIDPKVGHAGTLDKFAEGLMIVLTGSMTRLNQLFSNLDKKYRATIIFGKETDTLDPEGEVIATSSLPTYEEIEAVIPSFLGKQMQCPPQYSALHINGKRASELARAGKAVEMAARPIEVYSYELVSYENGLLIADIHVSKGTYIRSLARDLGLALNARAYLGALNRFQIGPFSLDEAVEAKNAEAMQRSVANTDELLRRLDSVSQFEVSDTDLFSMANGSYPKHFKTVKEMTGSTQFGAFYSTDGILRAVGNIVEKRLIAQIHPYKGEKIT